MSDLKARLRAALPPAPEGCHWSVGVGTVEDQRRVNVRLRKGENTVREQDRPVWAMSDDALVGRIVELATAIKQESMFDVRLLDLAGDYRAGGTVEVFA